MKRLISGFIVFALAVSISVWLQSALPQAKEVISTVLGASIALGSTWLFKSEDTEKSARYLAVRLICLFDEYMEDCVSVVNDDGLYFGERRQDGCRFPQVAPPQLVYPDDVDWRSINGDLMYEILSLPSDVKAGDSSVEFSWQIANAPDFEEFFEDRAFHYAQFGLRAYDLAQKLRKEYDIPEKNYADWNPVSILSKELKDIKTRKEQTNP